MKDFLPITIEEIQQRGWEQIDFLFVSGDAYVDQPSFGPAVICRVLEAQGYKVALLCQPDWRRPGCAITQQQKKNVKKIITRRAARWANALTTPRLFMRAR